MRPVPVVFLRFAFSPQLSEYDVSQIVPPIARLAISNGFQWIELGTTYIAES